MEYFIMGYLNKNLIPSEERKQVTPFRSPLALILLIRKLVTNIWNTVKNLNTEVMKIQAYCRNSK